MPLKIREGSPDPLIYYLHATALAHNQLIAAAASDQNQISDIQLGNDLQDSLNRASPWALIDASQDRLASMLKGIDKWRNHPYQKVRSNKPVIWSKRSAQLIDYGESPEAHPVLIIPSLINKPYILDLMDEASFLQHLGRSGLRPVLLDWGPDNDPGGPQSINDYLTELILPAFAALELQSKTKPGLLGYCMGGTLAVGAAQLLETRVSKLSLIGAPWDFSALSGISKALKEQILQTGATKTRASLQGMGHHFGAIPAHIFQHLFAYLSPMQVVQKFTNFNQIPQDSPKARKFVAVEDWLADGVCVKAPAAETILIDWYVENQTARGKWELMGQNIDPRQIKCPTLVITGNKDHIVPRHVSEPLASLIPDAHHCPVDMGHVGMIVGRQAHARVADRISHFFDAR